MPGGGHHSFEEQRPLLLGLAYRMLGSRADAEDAVQDTYLRWREAEVAEIENPAGWLTTVCTRRCLDLLKAAHRSRVDYFGAWLPEPLDREQGPFAAEDAELASSLSTAFLLMLERLTPKERAAFLLHDVFDLDYPEVAAALGLQPATCRKLVSRARRHAGREELRSAVPSERQEALLAAFETAIASGETGALAGLLAAEVALTADGGGKATAIPRPLLGKERVLAFIETHLGRWWRNYARTPFRTNGGLGLLLRSEDGIVGAVTFDYGADGQVLGINVMRNPDKLAGLSGAET